MITNIYELILFENYCLASEEGKRIIKIAVQKGLEYRIVPKGTKLYRSAPIGKINLYSDLKSQVRKCTDTGKTGIYLSNSILIPLAMMLEYDKKMEIGEFEILEDIFIIYGKYDYRNINPEKYFNSDGTVKIRISPSIHENISHIDCGAFPLVKEGGEIKQLIPRGKEIYIQERDKKLLCEMFLSSNELNSDVIKLTTEYKLNDGIDLQKLLKIIRNNDYPLNIPFYIENKVLVKN